MFIVVNSITIKIHSKAFHASFELWQLQGYSVNPNWQQSDLRLTRITDPQRGEVRSLQCSYGAHPCFCMGTAGERCVGRLPVPLFRSVSLKGLV